MEKYLHAGSGACLLREPESAEIVLNELARLAEWNVDVPHFSIMPNHWHALLRPHSTCVHSLGEMMKRVKGRTGRHLRQIHDGHGPVWQREWFDRWIRDEPKFRSKN